ncbi:hypothetical protein [Macrococcus bovicus]|uniref:N-acetyltransferase domain-containing protein n=1 Tax=Macrococcus bovicus TaxID=69968 RepID=A0A4R6BWT8_9STAP|nr:hypothetical protein [Macrococcus bovicus]TDM12682.1 hypothetical protein ERX55_10525 [Macrococcus bovicus]
MAVTYMNNVRPDKVLYILDYFEEKDYFTREDVILDYVNGTQHIVLDGNKPVAVFTLERILNRKHFKRFSILNDQYGRGYFKATLEQLIKYKEPIVLTVLPTNEKVIRILKELGFERVDGQVKSRNSDNYYDLYEIQNFKLEGY